MGDADDFYEVLGVPPTATAGEVESAYRRLARKTHPDVGGTSSLFRLVQKAHETLSDPARRAEYDRSGPAPAGTAPPPGPAAPTGSAPPPPGSGWIRVDEPAGPGGPGDAYPPPGGPGWVPAAQPGAPAGVFPPAPAAPARRGRRQTVPGRLARRQPWMVLTAAGAVLLALSSVPALPAALTPLQLLELPALPCLAAGLVAGVGSRRAARRIAARGVSAARVDAMTGTAFGHFCAEVLRAAGHPAAYAGWTGDYGPDLVVASPGLSVVQATRCSGEVGPGAVQQAVTARGYHRASRAAVLTNSYFTPAAADLARRHSVTLMDRRSLLSMAEEGQVFPLPSPPWLLARQLGAGLAVLGRLAARVLWWAVTDSFRR